MPKKPPFNHFRKSCCSPSNSNKKKKKLQVPSVPCKKCACLYHRWVWGEGERGEQKRCFWWPCQPLPSPWHMSDLPAPEDRFLRAGTCMWHWYTCLQQRVRSGECPPCLAVPAGRTGAPVPTHQRNPLPGHTGSTGSRSVSTMPQQSFASDHTGYHVP